MQLEHILPEQIEARSFELIEAELPHALPPQLAPIIKRVIHTTADFEYADSLCFSADAVRCAHEALLAGATIITDTNMVKAGINKAALQKLGGNVQCFMADADIAEAAAKNGTTRAAAAMDKAAALPGKLIFAVGNAPTALVRLRELMDAGRIAPALVIGVPVGFVNVVASKELIMAANAPYIIAKGRKGGSNVAAAIVNALMYQLTRKNEGNN